MFGVILRGNLPGPRDLGKVAGVVVVRTRHSPSLSFQLPSPHLSLSLSLSLSLLLPSVCSWLRLSVAPHCLSWPVYFSCASPEMIVWIPADPVRLPRLPASDPVGIREHSYQLAISEWVRGLNETFLSPDI
ncbi:hypothetical protein BO94DRAFT_285789 [Aspergillus sclerotioniger CBS 115572]|uniref:Uncharacterized protein n=1 Tax=Aspergillus sclerotioniger CBS 115572 TaxID=1450535 RepID=A0A317X8B2_9EURO|nr:hypothetical protein BO94DRAFT_285789 [Aspergillus sclerotioniger CBS 115572]PWY94833.1 hypothetical protein BO94DRAFT_285789 [Aspergillus sclerotioniger CBS 115572]